MSVQSDVRVTVRVDSHLKESADSLFERLGLNMSVAFNMFLRKAVSENAIPFPVSTNNIGFGRGWSASHVTDAFNAAVENDVAVHQARGLPIAKYDATKKQAYLETPDGSREYVHG